MKKLLLLLLIVIPWFIYSQTDSEIANKLLGTSAKEIEKTLDSVGVWHNLNYYSEYNLDLSISIATGSGTVKVYMVHFKFNKNKTIEKIVINYRHDNKQHLMDLKNMEGESDRHEGKYSTDVTFKLK